VFGKEVQYLRQQDASGIHGDRLSIREWKQRAMNRRLN
jgi:hypothetical protein